MAGKASHAIYFAKNITSAAAGANVVTVRFTVAAVSPMSASSSIAGWTRSVPS
jgi:hypothetical protein